MVYRGTRDVALVAASRHGLTSGDPNRVVDLRACRAADRRPPTVDALYLTQRMSDALSAFFTVVRDLCPRATQPHPPSSRPERGRVWATA